ncbi:MAG TPA: tetratricopeptide repeat protein [Anaerolineales bacterium]|nr:tetratricopeptide repeat protein [Anaerolineales bacterium]
MAYFWQIHGHDGEGRNWFDQALTLEAQSPSRKYLYAWAAAVNGHFTLSWYMPRKETFKERMEEALKIFRQFGDAFRTGHTLYYLAIFPFDADDFETAISTYQAGLDVYQSSNNPWGVGECLHYIAHVAEERGNFDGSHALYNQSGELLKPIGDRWSLFHPVGDTAVIALNRGELDTARMILEESIQAFEELKNPEWTSTSLNRLTEVFCEQGKYEHARKINQRNLLVQREMNNLGQLGWTTELKGKIELAEGNLSLARQLYKEALAIAEKRNNQYSIGFIKVALGLIDCHEGNYRRGKEAIEIGIENVQKNNAHHATPLLVYRSHALWLEKDLPGAAESYRDTIKELQGNYFFIRIPECLEGLGKIAVLQHDLECAARLFGAAEAMREKMGTLIPPVQRGEYDAHIQTLHERMGTAFETTRSHGRAMTMEQAIEYALEVANQ